MLFTPSFQRILDRQKNGRFLDNSLFPVGLKQPQGRYRAPLPLRVLSQPSIRLRLRVNWTALEAALHVVLLTTAPRASRQQYAGRR